MSLMFFVLRAWLHSPAVICAWLAVWIDFIRPTTPERAFRGDQFLAIEGPCLLTQINDPKSVAVTLIPRAWEA
jgi:hypothetical protein